MPKTKSSSTVMTGVFLFLSPIASADAVAVAQGATEPWHTVLYGCVAALMAWFWIAVFIAYTNRVKAEGRLEGVNKAIATLGGQAGGSDGKTKS